MKEESTPNSMTTETDKPAEHTCPKCDGTGKYYYSNGGTYDTTPGIIVTHAFTWDVCDKCWGTGDASNPGENLLVKKLQKILARYNKEDSKLYMENKRLREALSRCSECNDLATSREYAKAALNKTP